MRAAETALALLVGATEAEPMTFRAELSELGSLTEAEVLAELEHRPELAWAQSSVALAQAELRCKNDWACQHRGWVSVLVETSTTHAWVASLRCRFSAQSARDCTSPGQPRRASSRA